MEVAECLNATDTSYLECTSKNGVLSECDCIKEGINGNQNFSVNNTDLYLNLNADEATSLNQTDSWYMHSPERINDCINKSDTSLSWKCNTFSTNFTESFCRCTSSSNFDEDAFGGVLTKSLYKGLENIEFPVKSAPNITISESHNDNNNENFISTEDYGYDFTQKDFSGLYAFLVVFFFICSFGFMIWAYKDVISRKCCKDQDDMEPLVFIAELEETL